MAWLFKGNNVSTYIAEKPVLPQDNTQSNTTIVIGITSINGNTTPAQIISASLDEIGVDLKFQPNGTNTNILYIPLASTSGVTGGLLSNSDYLAFSSALPAVLANTKIYVGNSSNIPIGVNLTLSATPGTFALSNAGVLTMPNADNSTRGLLSAADHTTFLAKQSAITTGTNLQYIKGDLTLGTLDTTAVVENTNLYYTQGRFDSAFTAKSTTNLSEGSNLYFTNGRAISSTLTSYSSGSGTISSSDSILTAIQKLNGNIVLLTGAIIYQSTWNASTNTPTLASGSGTKGYMYKVSTQGTQNLGNGSILYNIGDQVIYNGSTWDKIDGFSTEVVSVFGRSGVVVGSAADYSGVAMTGIASINGLVITANTGAITTGSYTATPITDSYISSASTWNAKQPQLNGTGFIKASGTSIYYIIGSSSQFIKADGSLDSTTYLSGSVSLTSGVSGILPGANGGTGVANTGFTITLGGNLTTTGSYNTTLAAGFSGTLTLPTATATLATLALSETLTNKTLTSPIINTSLESTTSGTLGILTPTTTTVTTANLFTSTGFTTVNLLTGAYTTGTVVNLLTGYDGTHTKTVTLGNGSDVAWTINASMNFQGAATFNSTGVTIKKALNIASNAPYNIALSNTLGIFYNSGAVGAGVTDTRSSGTSWAVANYYESATLNNSHASTTYTNGATIYINGGITAGSNVSAITNNYALYVASGNVSISTVTSGTWNGTKVSEVYGGTNQSSYTTGDILYASASNTLSKLAGVATGNVLISGGVSTAPSWGKVGLTTHVSGNLPVSNLNSGTGASSSTFWRGDGTWSSISGSGATSISGYVNGSISGTDISVSLTNPIPATDLVGTDIATVGTVSGGSWQANPIGDAYIASSGVWNNKIGAIGDLVIGSTVNTILYVDGSNSLQNATFTPGGGPVSGAITAISMIGGGGYLLGQPTGFIIINGFMIPYY